MKVRVNGVFVNKLDSICFDLKYQCRDSAKYVR